MGLQYRFNFPTQENEKGEKEFQKATDIFIKQVHFEFEDFVADIMRKKLGGKTFTTAKSGDFGVDFEHETEDGLFFGQTKAWKDDLNFTPIALIHSNMIKQEAKGGYVITTSDFTPAAKRYAADLNIELINGIQLVDYWLESMDSKIYEPTNTFA